MHIIIAIKGIPSLAVSKERSTVLPTILNITTKNTAKGWNLELQMRLGTRDFGDTFRPIAITMTTTCSINWYDSTSTSLQVPPKKKTHVIFNLYYFSKEFSSKATLGLAEDGHCSNRIIFKKKVVITALFDHLESLYIYINWTRPYRDSGGKSIAYPLCAQQLADAFFCWVNRDAALISDFFSRKRLIVIFSFLFAERVRATRSAQRWQRALVRALSDPGLDYVCRLWHVVYTKRDQIKTGLKLLRRSGWRWLAESSERDTRLLSVSVDLGTCWLS